MEIRLKKGSRVKSDAQTIFAAIEAAKDDGGNVSLQALVDNAKPNDAPLHREFTWNDGQAAKKWRLEEARQITKSLEIIHEDSKPTRAYESVTIVKAQSDPEQKPVTRRVFRSVEEIMADPGQRNELLVQALRDAAAWRRRYAALQELAQVFAAIDTAILNQEAA